MPLPIPVPDPAVEIVMSSQGMSKGLRQTEGPQLSLLQRPLARLTRLPTGASGTQRGGLPLEEVAQARASDRR